MIFKRKGQKELTMIISLIILLVVAVVTISLFLQFFGKKPPIGEDAIEKAQFEANCQSKCNDIEAAFSDTRNDAIWSYCAYSQPLQKSEDQDLIIKGAGEYSYCRSSAHCFNIDGGRCMSSGYIITPALCLQTMCKILTKDISQSEAEQKIKKLMAPGQCNLRKSSKVIIGSEEQEILVETWWEKYFENPDCSDFSGGGGDGTPEGGCIEFCQETENEDEPGTNYSSATDDECMGLDNCLDPNMYISRDNGAPCSSMFGGCCCTP